MFYKLFLPISIYFFLYTPVSIYSQSDSLYHYLEIAAKNNPSVQQKFAEHQAALQKIPQAGSLSDPELSLGIFLEPMELVNGKQIADLRLMQMFSWFGALKAAKDEMSLMANAKFELFREAKLQVYYDVQRTWYELIKINREITVSERNAEILRTIESLAISKFRASHASGNVPGSVNPEMNAGSMPNIKAASMGTSSGNSDLTDLYRIQIETGELQSNISLLKDQRKTIVARFNSYLNRPASAQVFTPETISPDSTGLSLISVADSILGRNPMLKMLEYEEQSLDVRGKMVRKMSYPMIGLGLSYSLINKNEMSESLMNGNDMIMPMVAITLPIYRKKYKAMINEAELLKTAASQNYTLTANTLQTEYYQAIQHYRDAQRRIKLYDNQFQLASKVLELTLKSFSASTSDLTEVLRIRQQVLDYELKQIEAVADLNISVALLKKLMAFRHIF